MPQTDTTALYQKFPHLKEIDKLWGTRDARDFIKSLMSDSRDGARQGFSLEHSSTLFALLVEHDEEFPQFDDSHAFNTGDD
ncbi:hypothetical protein [Thiorhodovibrio frisius]|uniref:Uncharacterized protein n=1 Tax=Thiorhodovibrio frisius TaxID=631362 RepID=H8YZC3_9GAMM|nr:hypothetical protein [Thiorhodovibrio frisius]EIC22050.1 hypothetical protein Thi970DRAFT_02292 [Thiorhodovibrio frisius]WPL24341.1 hypothetical protein Thiofri_04558 [Thiorhodovibrio frisius]